MRRAAAGELFPAEAPLESGARPAALLVDYHPAGLTESHAIYAEWWPHLLVVRELAELAWTARDPDFFTRTVLARLLPSVRDRREVRANILAVLWGGGESMRQYNAPLRRNVRANLGAKVIPKNPLFRGEIALPLRQSLLTDSWACTPVNSAYVRRFLELADAQDPRLLAPAAVQPGAPGRAGAQGPRRVLPAVRPCLAGAVPGPGRRRRAAVRLRRFGLHRRDARRLAGGVHLQRRRGGRRRPAPRRPARGQRWVALPPYRERGPEVPLEHFAQSVAVVNRKESRRR